MHVDVGAAPVKNRIADNHFAGFGWKPVPPNNITGVNQWQYITPAVCYLAAVGQHAVVITLVNVVDGHKHNINGLQTSDGHPQSFNLETMLEGTLIEILGRIADDSNSHTPESAPVSFVQFAINELSSIPAHGERADNIADLVRSLKDVEGCGWDTGLYAEIETMWRSGGCGEIPAWFGALMGDADKALSKTRAEQEALVAFSLAQTSRAGIASGNLAVAVDPSICL